MSNDPLVKRHLDKLYESLMTHPGGYQREEHRVRFNQACETAALFLGTTAGQLTSEAHARWLQRNPESLARKVADAHGERTK